MTKLDKFLFLLLILVALMWWFWIFNLVESKVTIPVVKTSEIQLSPWTPSPNTGISTLPAPTNPVPPKYQPWCANNMPIPKSFKIIAICLFVFTISLLLFTDIFLPFTDTLRGVIFYGIILLLLYIGLIIF